MNVLSLFDGISCARVALDRAQIKVDNYFASEIDKYAISIANKNFPKSIQIGDVKEVSRREASFDILSQIDILIGGSPCQDLSIAKKNRKGLNGERSGLFWEYLRILKEFRPRYFILENVNSMPSEAKNIISRELGIEPIMINAALVSAQNRKRLFWVGKRIGEKYEQVHIDQPEDRNILLKDILDDAITEDSKSYAIDANYFKGPNLGSNGGTPSIYKGKRQVVYAAQLQGRHLENGKRKDIKGSSTVQVLEVGQDRKANTITSAVKDSLVFILQLGRGRNSGGIKSEDGKTPTLTSSKWEYNNLLSQEHILRKLTPVECERLQGLPDNYTFGVSNTQRYKCLGNAFNVDVVTHILKTVFDKEC